MIGFLHLWEQELNLFDNGGASNWDITEQRIHLWDAGGGRGKHATRYL